jgi:Ca2+-dependent lipid-binding protein
MRNINNCFVMFLQDPFLLISKIVEVGLPIPVCKTEVLKNDHNPVWKPIYLSIQQVGSKVKTSSMSCPCFIFLFEFNTHHGLPGQCYLSN